MKKLLAILLLTMFTGCGHDAYQLAKQDIARQYAELEQIQDLELRKQKFAEIQQRENILEGQQQAEEARRAQLLGTYMLYQGMTQPKTYNVKVKPAP